MDTAIYFPKRWVFELLNKILNLSRIVHCISAHSHLLNLKQYKLKNANSKHIYRIMNLLSLVLGCLGLRIFKKMEKIKSSCVLHICRPNCIWLQTDGATWKRDATSLRMFAHASTVFCIQLTIYLQRVHPILVYFSEISITINQIQSPTHTNTRFRMVQAVLLGKLVLQGGISLTLDSLRHADLSERTKNSAFRCDSRRDWLSWPEFLDFEFWHDIKWL